MFYLIPRQPTHQVIQYDDGKSPKFPEQLYDAENDVYLGYVTLDEAIKFVKSRRAIVAIEVRGTKKLDLHENAKKLVCQVNWRHMTAYERLLRTCADRGDFAMIAKDADRIPSDMFPRSECPECDTAVCCVLHMVPIEFARAIHYVSEDTDTRPSLSEHEAPAQQKLVKALFSAEKWASRVMYTVSMPTEIACSSCQRGVDFEPMERFSPREINDLWLAHHGTDILTPPESPPTAETPHPCTRSSKPRIKTESLHA